MILFLIVLFLLFGGFGGRYYGTNAYGPDYGYHGAGGGLGIVLLILLVLYLTGALHGLR